MKNKLTYSLFLFFSFLMLNVFVNAQTLSKSYKAVIDAGSSGSRIYLYEITKTIDSNLPNIKLVGNEKVEPGVSEFEYDPAQGKNNILELLTAAKEMVALKDGKKISLSLMATAGLRLVSNKKRARILNKITKVIQEEGNFNLENCMTISGKYEGLYSWLALNYLDDRFDNAKKRESVLEMGGASTQIVFVPESRFRGNKLKRKINGEKYKIYSKSFLYLGINEAEKLLGIPACYPLNYDMGKGQLGTGECEKCKEHVIDKFDSYCEDLEDEGPHCIFKSFELPSLQGEFVAISAFYYTLSTIGFDENIDFSKLEKESESLCGMEYKELVKKFPDYATDYVHLYCLSSIYYNLLFKNVYNFQHSESTISVGNEIDGTDISWTLGAILDMEMGFKPEHY